MGQAVSKPNARFPHTFIVLRIDDYQDSSAEVENKISAVATYVDRVLADDEAARLNELQRDEGSRYVVLTSRLKG